MSHIRHLLHRKPFQAAWHTRIARRHAFSDSLPFDLPLQSRIRWSYFWYASILALGITTGLSARHFAAPLGLLPPGSPEDKLILQSLGQDIDKLEIVRTLRKQSFNLHNDTSLVPSVNPGSRKIWGKGWVELDVDPSKNGNGEGSTGMLDAMTGTRGLGVQRAFWNAETRELVAVVWIGGGLAGWPGVAHGGVIATIFEEALTRMVRGPVGDEKFQHRPASMSITYAKPTHTLDFYILRASFSKPDLPQTKPPPESEAEPTKSWLSWLSPQKDLTKKVEPMTEITATLENVKGDLCVKVKATFATNEPAF